MEQENFFFAIGPPKTGTTWLYAMLKEHPEVNLPLDKELFYFWTKEFIEKDTLWNRLFGKHWYFRIKRRNTYNRIKQHLFRIFRHLSGFKALWWEIKYFFPSRNDAWYKRLFDFSKLSGDITPKYCELSESSIAEIKKIFPNAKIIISLRDPIDRAWSRAKMTVLQFNNIKDYKVVEPSKMYENFMHKEQHKANDYAALVEKWKQYFSEENIFVFFYEELMYEPEVLFKNICIFLNIKPHLSQRVTTKINKGIPQDIPLEYKEELIRLNYDFIVKMVDYFNSPYPITWLQKYSSARK